jgi:hypothetical protein
MTDVFHANKIVLKDTATEGVDQDLYGSEQGKFVGYFVHGNEFHIP